MTDEYVGRKSGSLTNGGLRVARSMADIFGLSSGSSCRWRSRDLARRLNTDRLRGCHGWLHAPINCYRDGCAYDARKEPMVPDSIITQVADEEAVFADLLH